MARVKVGGRSGGNWFGRAASCHGGGGAWHGSGLGFSPRLGLADRAQIRPQSEAKGLSPHHRHPLGKGKPWQAGRLPNTRTRLSSLRLVARCPGQLLFRVGALACSYRLRRAYVVSLPFAHNRDCNAIPYGLTPPWPRPSRARACELRRPSEAPR